MHFPQIVSLPTSRDAASPVRFVRTMDTDDLVAAQPDKNRRYVQLRPGAMESELLDARLGNVQVFRERLGAGMFVQAAPPAHLVPFGVVLSTRGAIRFCGREFLATSIAQATEGVWDIRFEGPIDYVSCVFQRPWFDQEVGALLGHAPPKDWFRNGGRPASTSTLGRLGLTIAQVLKQLRRRDSLLASGRIRRTIESEIVRLATAVLTSATSAPLRLAPYGQRQRAVRRVIEYLTDRHDPDTTISALCRIGGVSERTLEYGFRERLGMTPVRFLKVTRLNGARRDLLGATSPATTVTDVALHWGFSELGRFAGDYRRLFGELPSETLRRE